MDRTLRILAVVFAVFGGLAWLLYVGGCSPAAGAEPSANFAAFDPPSFAAFDTPAAGIGGGGGIGSTPPPVQSPQVGWWRWDGRGNVWFEPLTAPGVVAPFPFTTSPAPPTGAGYGDTTATTAPAGPGTGIGSSIARSPSSRSPETDPFRGLIGINVRGAIRSGITENCDAYG